MTFPRICFSVFFSPFFSPFSCGVRAPRSGGSVRTLGSVATIPFPFYPFPLPPRNDLVYYSLRPFWESKFEQKDKLAQEYLSFRGSLRTIFRASGVPSRNFIRFLKTFGLISYIIVLPILVFITHPLTNICLRWCEMRFSEKSMFAAISCASMGLWERI